MRRRSALSGRRRKRRRPGAKGAGQDFALRQSLKMMLPRAAFKSIESDPDVIAAPGCWQVRSGPAGEQPEMAPHGQATVAARAHAGRPRRGARRAIARVQGP